jgi:hypothetical protein
MESKHNVRSHRRTSRRSRRKSSKKPRRRNLGTKRSKRKSASRKKSNIIKKASAHRVRMLLPSNGRNKFNPNRTLQFDEKTGKIIRVIS